MSDCLWHFVWFNLFHDKQWSFWSKFRPNKPKSDPILVLDAFSDLETPRIDSGPQKSVRTTSHLSPRVPRKSHRYIGYLSTVQSVPLSNEMPTPTWNLMYCNFAGNDRGYGGGGNYGGRDPYPPPPAPAYMRDRQNDGYGGGGYGELWFFSLKLISIALFSFL